MNAHYQEIKTGFCDKWALSQKTGRGNQLRTTFYTGWLPYFGDTAGTEKNVLFEVRVQKNAFEL